MLNQSKSIIKVEIEEEKGNCKSWNSISHCMVYGAVVFHKLTLNLENSASSFSRNVVFTARHLEIMVLRGDIHDDIALCIGHI